MTDITTMLFISFLLNGLIFWIEANYEWVSDKTFSPIKPEHKMLFGESVYPGAPSRCQLMWRSIFRVKTKSI